MSKKARLLQGSVRRWWVCHPDGQDLGLSAPVFNSQAEAIAKRDEWNKEYPGHYVLGIGEASDLPNTKVRNAGPGTSDPATNPTPAFSPPTCSAAENAGE